VLCVSCQDDPPLSFRERCLELIVASLIASLGGGHDVYAIAP
jgi:hypothetical protein